MPHGLRLCWAGAVASPRRLLPRTWARVSCRGRGADPQACPALLHKEHLGLGCSGPTSGWGTWLCFTPRGSSGCRTQKGPMPSLCALDGSPRARIAGAQLCQKTNADAAPNLIFFFIYTLSGSKKHFRQRMSHTGAGSMDCGTYTLCHHGHVLNLSEPQFPHLRNGDTIKPCGSEN